MWIFKLQFKVSLDDLISTINLLSKSLKEIKENKNLIKILSYIVTIGNILNGGTAKGQADGFHLDFISKISSIKDNKNKTMLDFLLIDMKSKDENFEGLRKEIPSLDDAIKVSLSETTSGFEKLKKEIIIKENEVQKIDLDDDFMKKLKKIFEDFKIEIDLFSKKILETVDSLKALVIYFGYPLSDVKYKKPEEFLTLINEFIKDVDKRIPKTEPKKAFKGTHEMGKKITDTKDMDQNQKMNVLLNNIRKRNGT